MFHNSVDYYHSFDKFGIKPGLQRIKELCKLLGDPQNSFKCVHVAGTNGKGSVCTEIASVLTAAGYKTGLYTSPYVIDFRERIKFNGEMISENELDDVTLEVSEAINILNKKNITVTEFEAVTAAAFLYYKKCGCEIAVIETGLGGRFDATNIIPSPLCSVITSVSYDHMKILGDTLSEIAYEKCGIIKHKSQVVTSINQEIEVLRVIKNKCWEEQSVLTIAGKGCFSAITESIYGSAVKYKGKSYNIPFCGEHQLENAALSFSVLEILQDKGYNISYADICAGLKKAFIPARTEIIKKNPLIILDGSHNEGSTAALALSLYKFLNGKKIIAVMGMMADKDYESSLNNILPFFSKVIAVTPTNKRSLDSNVFCSVISKHGKECVAISDPNKGIDIAYSEINKYDAMVVCGSLYLASDVRKHLLEL